MTDSQYKAQQMNICTSDTTLLQNAKTTSKKTAHFTTQYLTTSPNYNAH